MYLSSNKENYLAYNNLLNARNLTNKHIQLAQWWAPIHIPGGPEILSTEQLQWYIDTYRDRVMSSGIIKLNESC